jgi:hypothetical protein
MIWRNTFYWGEFGHFNACVLRRIEMYIDKFPDRQLSIATYRDYFAIVAHLFPGKCIYDNSGTPPPSSQRRRYGPGQSPMLGCPSGIHVPLFEHLVNQLHTDTDRMPLERPITIEPLSAIRPFISICCRNRPQGENRQCSRHEWLNILELVVSLTTRPLVFHGLPKETFKFTPSGSILCKNIYESVSYLNKSVVLVTSMTGFAQFAANCVCNTLQIGPLHYFFPYHPFGTQSLQVDQYYLECLKCTLQKLDV